ncbi:MAG: hypothetical protein LBS43_06320 [Prevotellaceae bacterium]|jgi:hypothetical protein|nr:hypothetical protein [Prevotellaceae bacterium]
MNFLKKIKTVWLFGYWNGDALEAFHKFKKYENKNPEKAAAQYKKFVELHNKIVFAYQNDPDYQEFHDAMKDYRKCLKKEGYTNELGALKGE